MMMANWVTAEVKCIKYWFRLLRQPANLLSKKMLLTFDGNEYIITWVSRVRSLLCINGFGQVWLLGCGDEGIFVKELNVSKDFTVHFAISG